MAYKVGHGKDWSAYSNMLSNKRMEKTLKQSQRFVNERHFVLLYKQKQQRRDMKLFSKKKKGMGIPV